jgi:hypothetical protein
MENLTKKERKKLNKEQGKKEDNQENQQQNVQSFVGMFSALKDQFYSEEKTYKSSLQDTQESMSNADLGEVTLLFQRLNKKSGATK